MRYLVKTQFKGDQGEFSPGQVIHADNTISPAFMRVILVGVGEAVQNRLIVRGAEKVDILVSPEQLTKHCEELCTPEQEPS